jgi:hypothetical protein
LWAISSDRGSQVVVDIVVGVVIVLLGGGT